MTVDSVAAFALAFLLLAIAPGPGLAAIVSRALASGAPAGFAVTTGLIAGDFLFMGIAIVGLSAVAAALGPMFQFVKYAGAAYLIWLGCRMLLTAAQPIAVPRTATGAFWRDAGLGLLVTLGNPKPILFYGAIVPALFDVRAIGGAGFVLLAVIVAAISYAVYGLYIAAARRTRRLVASTRTVRRLNQATGTLLIGTGLAAAAR